MNISIKGPWSHREIEQYLGLHKYPVRLSAVGEDGYPRVTSLWYQYREGAMHCVTHRDSGVASLLAANNRVGFEVSTNETPYHGVRGQALATSKPLGDSSVLRDSLNDYLGGLDSQLATWLLSRSSEELLITLEFKRLYSWDYRKRMQAGE